jgi:hypothetical protein
MHDDQSHEGQKRHLLRHFHSKELLVFLQDFKHHQMLCIGSFSALSLLNENITKGVAYDPHDFNDNRGAEKVQDPVVTQSTGL